MLVTGLALLISFGTAAWFARDPHAGLRRALLPDPSLFDRLSGSTYTSRLDRSRTALSAALSSPRDAAKARSVVEELVAEKEAADRVWGLSLARKAPWGPALALGSLGDPDETVVTEAQQLLVEARPVPVEALATAIEQGDAKVRSRALGVVGQLGVVDPVLEAAVRGRLDDPEVEVRWEASVTWARMHAGEDLTEELLPRLARERGPGGHPMVSSTLLYALMHQPPTLALLPLYEETLRSADRRDVAIVLWKVAGMGAAAAALVPAIEKLRGRAGCGPAETGCTRLEVEETLAAIRGTTPSP